MDCTFNWVCSGNTVLLEQQKEVTVHVSMTPLSSAYFLSDRNLNLSSSGKIKIRQNSNR